MRDFERESFGLSFPEVVFAKVGPWWRLFGTEPYPRPLALYERGHVLRKNVDQYRELANDSDRPKYSSKYRVLAAGCLKDQLLTGTLYDLVSKDARARPRALSQAEAVKAIFQALRTGRYRGVIKTDIRHFDRTIDRQRARALVVNVLVSSDLSGPARRCLLKCLDDLGVHSEAVFAEVDDEHHRGFGLLSGSQLMSWITWCLSVPVRDRWRQRGYEVFWVGEDILLLADRDVSPADYDQLTLDVEEILGQALHPLPSLEEVTERRQDSLFLRETFGLPETPVDLSPFVGPVREGFRFVGFEFQQVKQRGVRIRISQKTHQRLIWSINRATRTDWAGVATQRDMIRFIRNAAGGLEHLLGPTGAGPHAARTRMLSYWHNREIELQVRSLDHALAKRLRRLFGEDGDVRQQLDRLAQYTGRRLNSFSDLYRASSRMESATAHGASGWPAHP